MWEHIWVIIIFMMAWFGFSSLIADKVEKRLNDRLDEIEKKLDLLIGASNE